MASIPANPQRSHPRYLVNIHSPENVSTLDVFDTETENKFTLTDGFTFGAFAWFEDKLYVVSNGTIRDKMHVLEIDPKQRTVKSVWFHQMLLTDIYFTSTNLFCMAQGEGYSCMLVMVHRYTENISHVYSMEGLSSHYRILGGCDNIYVRCYPNLLCFNVTKNGVRHIWDIPFHDKEPFVIDRMSENLFVASGLNILKRDAYTGKIVYTLELPNGSEEITALSIENKSLVVCTHGNKVYATRLTRLVVAVPVPVFKEDTSKEEKDASSSSSKRARVRSAYAPLELVLDFGSSIIGTLPGPIRSFTGYGAEEYVLRRDKAVAYVKDDHVEVIDWGHTCFGHYVAYESHTVNRKTKTVYALYSGDIAKLSLEDGEMSYV